MRQQAIGREIIIDRFTAGRYLSHIRKRTKIALQRDSSMSREAAIFSLDDSFPDKKYKI